ncbi:MAG: hypothetical protein FWE67_15445 [Planctomycetaceae bacterium]|nr:hypothetical protein [Planctomycetaceae bacterium]
MATCKKAKQTGKPCANGYSRKIQCVHSKTQCLRDCTPEKCKHYEPAEGSYATAPQGGTWARGCGGCGG